VTEKTEKKVIGTFIARRKQSMKVDDPVINAADEVTQLYGRLSMRLSAEEVLVAIFLSERALYAVLRGAVGKERLDTIRKEAIQRAVHRYAIDDDCVPDETVYDKDKDGLTE
jgi:hypothetical protein